jgi:hypothetical protein
MDNRELVGAPFIEAAKLQCHAKIKEAEAKISLYANASQGIADHSNIMEEIMSAAAQGAHALDILSFLEDRC